MWNVIVGLMIAGWLALGILQLVKYAPFGLIFYGGFAAILILLTFRIF